MIKSPLGKKTSKFGPAVRLEVPADAWTRDKVVRLLGLKLLEQVVEVKQGVVVRLGNELGLAAEDLGPDQTGEGLVGEPAVRFRVRHLKEVAVALLFKFEGVLVFK